MTFVYGTSPSLTTGTTTTAGQSVGSGTDAVFVSAALAGLSPGTAYYFQVVATSTGGTADGSVAGFNTAASAYPGGVGRRCHHGDAQRERQPRGARDDSVLRLRHFTVADDGHDDVP